jgi:hypothetical protein
MNSTRKSSDIPKPSKFHVDPRLLDKITTVYNNHITNLLLMSATDCKPDDLKYAMARASGLLQAIQLLEKNTTQEVLNGRTILPTGSGAGPGSDRTAGEGGQDRTTEVSEGPAKNPDATIWTSQPPQSRPKDPRSKRRKRWF